MYDPGIVELRLRVAVPDPVTAAGWMDALRLKDAKTERLTIPVKPSRDVIIIVEVPGLPLLIVIGLGLAEMEKSGAITVMGTNIVWLSGPLVPVTST